MGTIVFIIFVVGLVVMLLEGLCDAKPEKKEFKQDTTLMKDITE